MPDLYIQLANKNKIEEQAAERLLKLLSRYEIDKILYTHTVLIETKAIPHSHPILTLNTFPYNDENIILVTFIHEQLHWYFDSLENDIKNSLISALKNKFPDAPWGEPVGCIDQISTYEHLVICHMAQVVLAEFVGNEAANKVLYYLQNHHYIWVHKKIEDEEVFLNDLIEKYKLDPRIKS